MKGLRGYVRVSSQQEVKTFNRRLNWILDITEVHVLGCLWVCIRAPITVSHNIGMIANHCVIMNTILEAW